MLYFPEMKRIAELHKKGFNYFENMLTYLKYKLTKKNQ